MITSENEPGISPEDLARLRTEALDRQTGKSKQENSGQSEFDEMGNQSADSSLQMSRFLAVAALVIIAAAVIWPASFSGLFVAWGILLLYCVHSIYQQNRRRFVLNNNSTVGFQLPLPKSSTLWGLTIPLAMTASLCFVLARSGLDTPIANKWVFLSAVATFCCAYVANAANQTISKPRFVGLLNGLTNGLAATIVALFAVQMATTDRFADFSIMLPAAGLVLVYSLALLRKLLLKVDAGASLSVFCSALVGTLISLAVGITPELRGLAIALGEKLAVSPDEHVVDVGYKILNGLNASHELEAAAFFSDKQKPVSLSETFAPIDASQARKLYFFVSGKTYSRPEISINSFQNVAVADPNAKVKGLSLVESKITGHVDAKSLTSVTYWTMVFGNSTARAQEAQAKISLPPNSAVSRVTLWVNGKPQEAAFNSTGRVTEAYQWITERHRDPLLITEPSRGVINMQAFPVPKYGEMKVRIGITSGLNVKSKRDFSFIAPHIISSNFGLTDAKTSVSLESNAPITSNAASGNSEKVGGKLFYTGEIEPGSGHSYQFVAHRASDFVGFSARATHSKEDMIISEKLVSGGKRLNKLAIVIDASGVAASKRDEIKRALARVPKSVSAQVFIADHREQVEALPVDQAISRLDSVEFVGGVDDAKALVAAKKFIGRNSDSSIVWIHGGQAVFYPSDTELLQQLLVSGEHRLKINELQLDDQANDAKTDLISWSRTASPDFQPIEQSGSVGEDLISFFNNATGYGSEYSLVREKVKNPRTGGISYNFPEASRLSTIWAADEARRCAELGQIDTAVTLGSVYRVVTPATGAVVMELQSDYEYQNLDRNFYSVVDANTRVNKAKMDPSLTAGYGADDSAYTDDASAPGAGGNSVGATRRELQLLDEAPVVTDSRVGGGNQAAFADKRIAPAPTSAPAPVPAPSPMPSAGPVDEESGFILSSVHRPRASRVAPSMDGATNGTVGPQSESVRFAPVEGAPGARLVEKSAAVDSATRAFAPPLSGSADAMSDAPAVEPGTVRVSNLSNFERAMNLFTLALQGLSVVFGALMLTQGFFVPKTRSDACKKLLFGSALLLFAIAMPDVANWIFGMGVEEHLFS